MNRLCKDNLKTYFFGEIVAIIFVVFFQKVFKRLLLTGSVKNLKFSATVNVWNTRPPGSLLNHWSMFNLRHVSRRYRLSTKHRLSGLFIDWFSPYVEIWEIDKMTYSCVWLIHLLQSDQKLTKNFVRVI